MGIKQEVTCKATHMSLFTVVAEKEPPQEVILITATDEESSDDDDWDYLKHFNPLYLGLGIAVIMTILVIAGAASDKKSSIVIPNLEPQTAGITAGNTDAFGTLSTERKHRTSTAGDDLFMFG